MTNQSSLITRRSILIGAAASLICALCVPRTLCRCAVRHFRLGVSMQDSSSDCIFIRSKEAYKQRYVNAESVLRRMAIQFQ